MPVSSVHSVVSWAIKSVCSLTNRLLDSLVVQCRVLASCAGGPGSIPSQGPRHTKDVSKMVPVVPLFITELGSGRYIP